MSALLEIQNKREQCLLSSFQLLVFIVLLYKCYPDTYQLMDKVTMNQLMGLILK